MIQRRDTAAAAGPQAPRGSADRANRPAGRGGEAIEYGVLAALAMGTLAVDVATKAWAIQNLSGPVRRVDLAPGVALALRRNYRDSWELLPRMGVGMSRICFPLVAVASLSLVLLWRQRLRSGNGRFDWGWAFVLGGALGNLLDRVRFGYVVDFINVSFAFGRLRGGGPTINLADIAIGAGIGVLALEVLRGAYAPRRS